MSGTIKRIGKGSLLILGLTFLCLTVHVLWSVRGSDDFHASIQLGRIDFPVPLTPAQSNEALQTIRLIDGIGITKINQDRTCLIYSFPSGRMNIREVGNTFARQVSFRSIPFIPDRLAIGSGCPVTGQRGLLTRLSVYIQNTF